MSHVFGLVIVVSLASVTIAQQLFPVVNFKIGNRIPDYLVQYPNATVSKVTPIYWRTWKLFRTGEKVPGQILLAQAANTLMFPTPQDASIEIKYPSPRNMDVITRFDVYISNDSNPADCYITSIGARNSSISAWVQSKATKKLQYEISFYGHNAVVEYPYTKIQIATKIEDYFTLYPSAIVTRMSETKYNNGTVRYYLGKRFGYDRLVSTANATYKFINVQDVALSLEYPQSNGTGLNITYTELLLTKSIGGNITAYIVAGGISRDYIKIWIHSQNTTIFNFDAKIYGYYLE